MNNKGLYRGEIRLAGCHPSHFQPYFQKIAQKRFSYFFQNCQGVSPAEAHSRTTSLKILHQALEEAELHNTKVLDLGKAISKFTPL